MSLFLLNEPYDTTNFLRKRELFLEGLLKICEYKIEWVKLKQPVPIWASKALGGDKEGFRVNYNPEFKLYTLSKNETGETIGVDSGEYFDGRNFNKSWNTRDILLSEGVIEIEKGTQDQNIKGTWDTCLNLIKLKIHFAVFYAEGMRTPHIHIYDLFEGCEDWAIKNLAMLSFIEKAVSLEYRHLVDSNLFEPHTIALEFSKHYKTGHIKKLVFEYVPGESNDK